MNAPNTTIYAIGDIHGRSDLVDQLYERIDAHARAASPDRKVLLHLGDYVDRGPDSKGVIERVRRGLSGFENIALVGNHEVLMLAYLDGNPESLWWLDQGMGGEQTLASFGITGLAMSDLAEAKRAIGEPTLDWLRALKVTHREGDLFFTHAGVMPGVPLDQQQNEHLIWIRDRFLNSQADFGARVVHGHTPRRAPVIRSNRIGLDTGAVWTGVLTAAVLDPTRAGDAPHILQAIGDPSPDYTPDKIPLQ